MLARIRGCLRNNRGQALVEMALVLPALLLIMAGTIEFGRVLNQYLVVTAAAREGARAVVVGEADETVAVTVREAAASIDKGSLTVDIDPVVPASRKRGSAVTVTVKNPMEINTPLVNAFLPSKLTVQGTVTMRME